MLTHSLTYAFSLSVSLFPSLSHTQHPISLTHTHTHTHSLSLSLPDMAVPALAKFGSHELKKAFLAPSLAGDFVACLGVSEPGSGSDVASIRTNARPKKGTCIYNVHMYNYGQHVHVHVQYMHTYFEYTRCVYSCYMIMHVHVSKQVLCGYSSNILWVWSQMLGGCGFSALRFC